MSNPIQDFLTTLNKTAAPVGVLKALGRGLALEDIKDVSNVGGRIANRVGQMATQGTIAAGLLGGAHAVANGVGSGLSSAHSAVTKGKDFEAMMSAHPRLKEEDPKQIQMVYESVRKLAPTLARDPLVAGTMVGNVLAQSSHGNTQFPAETARALLDAEKTIKGIKQRPESAAMKAFGGNTGIGNRNGIVDAPDDAPLPPFRGVM